MVFLQVYTSLLHLSLGTPQEFVLLIAAIRILMASMSHLTSCVETTSGLER